MNAPCTRVHGSAESTATRVANRYIRSNEGRTEVLISDGGVVSASDAVRLLRRQFGPMAEFKFLGPIADRDHEVAWKAIGPDSQPVAGTLVLHAGVSPREVVVWAELVPNGHREAGLDFRDRRLGGIAEIGRRLFHRLRSDEGVPTPALAAAIAAVVDLAEQGLGE